ncbi:uncharacterized protein LOC136039251 [Artemia franciscana]|uniref:Neurite outgrowth-associated protein n=1 Tax=Artemia franciscana TaxID=6661 RepID=A0AA88L8P5_ARTSF|nr:hypothetical protein QYM36_007130 [Artemia franciscana]
MLSRKLEKVTKVYLHISSGLAKNLQKYKASKEKQYRVRNLDTRKNDKLPSDEFEEMTRDELNPMAFDRLHNENERYGKQLNPAVERSVKERKFFRNQYSKKDAAERVLTMDERNLVREIYAADPNSDKIFDLSTQFGVGPQTIKKIVKNRVRPKLSCEEMKKIIEEKFTCGEFKKLALNYSSEPKPIPSVVSKPSVSPKSEPDKTGKHITSPLIPPTPKPLEGATEESLPYKTETKDGIEEAYIYTDKQGYEYPYGIMRERPPDSLNTNFKMSGSADGSVIQQGDSFYDAETGEFLYRVPGINKH